MTKIGRNDPCPCGSGHKYKKCHCTDVLLKTFSPEEKFAENICEIGRLLRASEDTFRGKWSAELDEEGFEIAVMRDGDERPVAFMNADAARAAGFVS